MGTRQELGIVVVVLLLALAGWRYEAALGRLPAPVCERPGPAQVESPATGLTCRADSADAWATLPGPARLLVGLPVDLNRASAADFQSLPGIGPVLAQRITKFRDRRGRIERIRDLTDVRGIGEAKFSRIRTLVTISGP